MADNSNSKDQTDSDRSSSSHKTNCNGAIEPWDILADHLGTKVNENFVLSLDKSTDFISDEVKEACKVFQFLPNWNFEELLTAIDNLDLRGYPNLLVVIVRSINFKLNTDSQFLEEPPIKKSKKCNEKVEEILSKFNSKFDSSRQLILQLSSRDENEARFYIKDELSNFIEIGKMDDNVEYVNNFSTFLCSFLGSKIQSIEQLTAAWNQLIKSTLILNFLKLFDDLFNKLVIEVTKKGKKIDLMTILDAPVEHEGRVLTAHARQYLTKLFDEVHEENQSTESNKDIERSSSDDSMTASDSKNIFLNKASTSLLITAIEHKKTEIIDYLITYWTHLIQELPFDHQVKASTLAFKTDQLDLLCDLLDIADFPFPEDYEFDDDREHKRLRKITLERMALSNAIKKENFEKIDGFIVSHISLKNVFSIDNDTVLTQAIEAKKFGVFYFLKSLGFQSKNCEDILNKLNKEDRKKATQQAVKQRKANVNQALKNVHKSVMLLATRSLIHNRRISKEQEAEYRQKIINWLQDIHKVAPEMLDVAASCEHLKIIFDFESYTVDNMNLETSNNLGLTLRISKWIFIGAKLSDQKKEQQIKGVLAHELCHYVMCLVYNNKYFPYFEDAEDVRDKFNEIVKAIDKWSADESDGSDDECNGNISGVFTCYDPKKFHLELIVRPVQNQVEFDDNKDQSANLEKKYRVLFDFWNTHVLFDLQNYCKRNPKIIKLNKLVELLPRIFNKELSTKGGKDIKKVITSKLAVVTTNVPILLFLDIVKELKKKCATLLDSQNFFTEPQRLNNEEIWNDFQEICKDPKQLKIFVDCTKGVPAYLENIFVNKELNLIFVVSDNAQREELMDIIKKRKIKVATKMEINYIWNDLTEESQKLLLDVKINFQKNSKISFKELFITKTDLGTETINSENKVMANLSEVIDDELLNLITDKNEFTTNSLTEIDPNEKNSKFLNMPRKFFIKNKINNIDTDSNQQSDNFPKISQESFLSEVKYQHCVLLSDKAGNGKSWSMKNFMKILRERNPTSWVTYVDLKQFIKKFKQQMTQQVMPEFSAFMAEKILRTEHKFESKIFQKLYKDGKVFILFDGFDEIAPDCAQFVSNLALSFQSNGGNQLWIATRDYFEVDLQKSLSLDVAYGLEEINENQGINLIARTWMLIDLKDVKEIMTVDNFNKHVEVSTNFKKYEEKARQIVWKVKSDWNYSVGMPQMFKMIADAYKDEQNIEEMKESEFYEKFIKILYRRWSREKGEIREEASIECQNKKFQFWNFHLYHAISSMFPKLVRILFPEYNNMEWKIEEVIACGILNTKNGEYYFIHETLREYFAADALAKALETDKIDDKVLEVLADVINLKQYKILVIFLNDIVDSTTFEKIQPKMKNFTDKFYENENFVLLFGEKLENLVDFVFSILKSGNIEKTKILLNKNSMQIVQKSKCSKLLFKFLDFICQFLTVNELKELFEIIHILNVFISGLLRIEIFADFVLKIESITEHEFVQKELRKTINEGRMHEWSFRFFFHVKDPKALKYKTFLEMLQKFLSPIEVQEFLYKKNNLNEYSICLCFKHDQRNYGNLVDRN